MLAIDTAGTYPEIQLLYTGSMTPGEICCKVSWLVTINPYVADSPENLLSLLKRFTLMTTTTNMILPQSHWEVYWLAFLCRRGAVFLTQTFPFCPYSIAILGIFWLSRWNWSIGCFRTIIGEHICLPSQKNLFCNPIWVIFYSFCQVWLNVHIAC